MPFPSSGASPDEPPLRFRRHSPPGATVSRLARPPGPAPQERAVPLAPRAPSLSAARAAGRDPCRALLRPSGPAPQGRAVPLVGGKPRRASPPFPRHSPPCSPLRPAHPSPRPPDDLPFAFGGTRRRARPCSALRACAPGNVPFPSSGASPDEPPRRYGRTPGRARPCRALLGTCRSPRREQAPTSLPFAFGQAALPPNAAAGATVSRSLVPSTPTRIFSSKRRNVSLTVRAVSASRRWMRGGAPASRAPRCRCHGRRRAWRAAEPSCARRGAGDWSLRLVPSELLRVDLRDGVAVFSSSAAPPRRPGERLGAAHRLAIGRAHAGLRRVHHQIPARPGRLLGLRRVGCALLRDAECLCFGRHGSSLTTDSRPRPMRLRGQRLRGDVPRAGTRGRAFAAWVSTALASPTARASSASHALTACDSTCSPRSFHSRTAGGRSRGWRARTPAAGPRARRPRRRDRTRRAGRGPRATRRTPAGHRPRRSDPRAARTQLDLGQELVAGEPDRAAQDRRRGIGELGERHARALGRGREIRGDRLAHRRERALAGVRRRAEDHGALVDRDPRRRIGERAVPRAGRRGDRGRRDRLARDRDVRPPREVEGRRVRPGRRGASNTTRGSAAAGTGAGAGAPARAGAAARSPTGAAPRASAR